MGFERMNGEVDCRIFSATVNLPWVAAEVTRRIAWAHNGFGLLTAAAAAYEADWRYQRNFEQGSAAYQLGHYAGYYGAEVGFQAGLIYGTSAFEGLATAASLRRVQSMAVSGFEARSMLAADWQAAQKLYPATPQLPPTRMWLSGLGDTTTASSGAGQGVTMNINTGAATAATRAEQLDLIKQGSLERWWGVRGDSGQMRPIGSIRPSARIHGNSLNATGPHDVYAIIHARTGQVLHIGETGQGYMARFKQHVRDFDKLGIDIRVKYLKTVEGKSAARELENKYINHYRQAVGNSPVFNLNDH